MMSVVADCLRSTLQQITQSKSCCLSHI